MWESALFPWITYMIEPSFYQDDFRYERKESSADTLYQMVVSVCCCVICMYSVLEHAVVHLHCLLLIGFLKKEVL